MTVVAIMPGKFCRSWPERPDKPLRPSDRAYALELGSALERVYATDAHFTAYMPTNGWRLNRNALEQGIAAELGAVVFDVDAPGHVATPEWREETRRKVLALAEVHPDPYFYETKGGARIVYRQEEPTVIATQADAEEWSRGYAVMIAYLARRFGIVADRGCSDWQRLYRLPRATREIGGKPENRPVWGNPDCIGDLFIEATAEDVAAAKRMTTAFRRTRRPERAICAGGDGLFFWALRLRGHIGHEAPRGGHIALCPNRHEHTVDTDWSDTTIVVPPDSGHELGLIVCLHGHCRERFTVQQWLRMFTDAELDAAREAAGIKKRERAA